MDRLHVSYRKTPLIMAGVHVHTHHELYYLLKGQTKFLIDGEVYAVEAGNAVIIPRSHYHMTDYGGNADIERYVLNFDDELFDADTRPLFEELKKRRLISIPVSYGKELERLFADLEQAKCTDDGTGDALRKISALAIFSFIYCHKRDFVPVVSESDRVMHRICEYVSRNYGEDLSLSMLSRRFSVSESHLSRSFKEAVGIGLNKYITFVRIINAERMLTEGETSITAVANRCGFNDPNYFTTVFKKIKGVTPLKFAKNAASR